MKNLAYLVAGGTGGHINAALSVGESLSSKYEVKYISGTRYLDYKLFKNYPVRHLESRPIRTKNPFKLIGNIFKNISVFVRFYVELLRNKPRFLVGAGGYICGPTLMAAFLQGIPVFIIEQNAVMGVTNKILAKIANKIFVNFDQTKGLENNKKVVVTGNPIRSSITHHPQHNTNKGLNILVFGGSLGAIQVNEAIKKLLSYSYKFPLSIRHQVGKNNKFDNLIKDDNISYEQYEYIEDMNSFYQWADVIISRAGASSVSELKIVGKPSLLIPYPAATDNHQYYNAINLKKEAQFYVEVLDQNLSIDDLANNLRAHIEVLMENKSKFCVAKKIIDKPAAEVIKEEIEICLGSTRI